MLCLVSISCSCARVNSIYRSQHVKNDTEIVAVDAKQRFLVTTPPAGDKLRQICLEPSPDVFSVLSAALEGNAQYKDKAKAEFKAALAEAAATIGVRTETIQLLRDAMYRICELALNGDMKDTQAYALHERYQRSMVTLAAVSALAEATRPTQVALTGRSTITRGGLMADLSKQLEQEKQLKKEKQATADSAAEELGKGADEVCKVTVAEDGCKSGLKECTESDSGKPLCDVEIKDSPNGTDEEKHTRAEQYCKLSKAATTDPCTTLQKKRQEKDAADQAVKYEDDAIKQLTEDLEKTKLNSDLSAVTETVRLGPTTVQPRQENIAAVACVVSQLVTQVYANGHIEYCLQVFERLEKAKRREQAAKNALPKLQVSVKTLSESQGFRALAPEISTKPPDDALEELKKMSSEERTTLGVAPELNKQIQTLSDLESEVNTARALMDLCQNLSKSLYPSAQGGCLSTPTQSKTNTETTVSEKDKTELPKRPAGDSKKKGR